MWNNSICNLYNVNNRIDKLIDNIKSNEISNEDVISKLHELETTLKGAIKEIDYSFNEILIDSSSEIQSKYLKNYSSDWNNDIIPIFDKYSIWSQVGHNWDGEDYIRQTFFTNTIKQYLKDHNCKHELRVIRKMEDKIRFNFSGFQHCIDEDEERDFPCYYHQIDDIIDEHESYWDDDGVFKVKDFLKNKYNNKTELRKKIRKYAYENEFINVAYCNYLEMLREEYNIELPKIKEEKEKENN